MLINSHPPKGLSYYRCRQGSYSTYTRIIKNWFKFIKRFESRNFFYGLNTELVGVNLKYNGNYYKLYDLDTYDKLCEFKDLYSDSESYVIFRSSVKDDKEKYWAIIDRPYKNIKNIFEDTYWLRCNDSGYVKLCRKEKMMLMRSTYSCLDRKPRLIETNKVLSADFRDMIKDIKLFINHHALELSIKIFTTNDLMVQMKKIKSVIDLNNKLKKVKKS